MPRFALRSLRSKLQLFAALLVLVPGIVTVVIAAGAARAALERAVGRQLAQIGNDTLDELAEAVADARAALVGWAGQDLMRDLAIGDLDKRVSRYLQSLTDDGEIYVALAAADASGRVVAASDPAILAAPEPFAAAAAAVLAGRTVRGEPAMPSDGGPLTVEIAVTVPDPDRPGAARGALVGRYDWRQAMARADRIRRSLLPHRMHVDVLVLGREGAVLGESWREDRDAAARGTVRDAVLAVARTLPADPPHGFRALETAGLLVGWDRGRGGGRLVVVSEPLAEAFAPVYRLQRGLAATLGAVLLAALVVATALAGRMSRPLRALTRATGDMLRPGAALRPVTVRSRDEIGTLADAFNGMVSALARAQEHLLAAAKFAFVGEVAAGIAHEVRTPLGIMRSSAQLLARRVPPEDRESAELAGMIVGEVDRIDRVVTGLLELARPREPRPEPTGLGPVLQRALDFVQTRAQEKRIALRREFVPAPPAECDGEQMYQVALNLLVNAIQIVPPGGTVTVRTLPAAAGMVGFEVTDDGPGIPSELRERLFTPFVSRRPGGTGLGLALVQRMVQAHHGTVSVDSEVGQGATFRVLVPVVGGAA